MLQENLSYASRLAQILDVLQLNIAKYFCGLFDVL